MSLGTAAAFGQEFTGLVTDQSGAVIPHAKITVHNQDTGVDLQTITTAAGNYTVPYLTPGHYSVSAEAQGFKIENKIDINLQVGKTAVINFSLAVGATQQTVTVNADQALLDKGRADQGEVVGQERVTQLPLNGGDPGMLSTLMAGAIWTGSAQWQRPFDDTQANLSVNGGGGGNTALMLDGVTNSAASTNNSGQAKIAYVPPTDAVKEFKIITNPYDAKYGLFAGGVEDVVLKSGTNDFHGDVYEFARRTWLDANTWQNDYDIHTALPGTDTRPYATPDMKWDQWGGSFGGPVLIPKLYNGRNKSFFTIVYQNFNEVEPNTITESVPSPQWKTGDFSNLVYWNGSGYSPITIYDPLSIHQNANGQWVRDAFGPSDPVNPSARNVIPMSRINPMAEKIISLYPSPNTAPPGGSNPFANNYTVPGNDTDIYRNVLARWDEVISPNDRFSILYGYWEREEHRSFDGFTGPEQEGQLPHGERSNTFTFEETHVFTPNLVFNFRANVGVRADYTFNGPQYDPTNLGYSAQQLAEMGPAAQKEFPYLDISEFASMGTDSNGQTISNQLSLLPSLTWVKNTQTINMGLDVRFMQSADNIVPGGNNFWIDRTWTQFNCGSCGSWDPASGNSIASLLLGNPTSGSDAINVPTFWSSHYWAPFVQDDWKVSRKLTLNLGIRWDFLPAETERHNRGNYAFDTTAVNPINSEVSVPGYNRILGGVTYLGVNGAPRAPYKLDLTNIQPRVGFAYAIHDKTVIRGGFGESMRAPQNAPSTFGFSASTSYIACDPDHPGCTYPNLANPISNPYSSVVQPAGASAGMREMLGQGPWFLNPHYRTPSFWNYSLGIQHQFLRNNIVNIAYVGSQLFNGDSSDNINHQNAAAYVTCNPQQGGRIENCSNNNVSNPFKGVNGFQGSSDYSASTISALDLTRPFPEFGDVIEYQLNDSHTWYNALQLTAMHTWSGGFVLHGTWTWSKTMDSGGWTDETYRVPYRSIDANDFTHRVTLSGVYTLPVGRGREFLGNENRVADVFLGGWELAGLYIYQSGAPWMIPGNPNEVYLHNAWVPRHIQQGTGFIRVVAACAEQYQENSNGQYVLQQLPFSYSGTCPQGADFQQVPNYGKTPNTVFSGIRIPGSQEFDANMSKNFALVRNLKLQIRVDAFNVLNHPDWAENPDGSTNDSTFGLILRGVWGQSNLPRQTQLSAKLTW
ncbi:MULTISPECIES: TonB-dependent receptor [Acidobacterium]|uniref:TonB-dependent receptor domain-containing protein n=1 Tax=Acidobacterium TaxID=33973 RepID=UPI0003181520|nr:MULTISPECIES: TonB-dependent receptor [Acidobacterium]HCT61720.1 TonB-dependent receptor [Acidobacterium sp.]